MRLLQSMGCFAPVVILIYGIVGFLILSQFGGQVFNYFRSTNWQQVSGTIMASNIENASDTSGERYTGNVIYTYEFDDVTYEGNQINLFGNIYVGNRDDAEQMIAPYPVGISVNPYINPNNPVQSVLDRSVSDAIWGLVGLGSILAFLSLSLGTRYLLGNRIAKQASPAVG
ncbi:MAG: DUF3592 domain-containing protein [Phototrophicaceae bacterium]